MKACAEIIACFVSLQIDECLDAATCSQGRSTIYNDSEGLSIHDGGPIAWLSELQDAYVDASLCSVCEEVLQEKVLERRLAIWDMLPSMFGLPGWKELRKLAKM